MRVWIDLTNSPHVLVMRPVIDVLRADGHEVHVTARDFAQTLALCERFGIECTAIGHHRGGKLAAKGLGLVQRSGALVRWARRHGSVRPRARPRLQRRHGRRRAAADPVQHDVRLRVGDGPAHRQLPPRAGGRRAGGDPAGAARALRRDARKLQRYPGLKEEYYLADFEPDPAVLDELSLDPAQPIVVVRTPPAVSLYHRFEHDTFGAVLQQLRDEGAQAVVLPRTPEQRAELSAAGGFTIPERAIDAQSLIAYADLVISAGGTMNREAVALGTPVFSSFEGRLGAVDEQLIAEGRLKLLRDPAEVVVAKRAAQPARRAATASAATRATSHGCLQRLLPGDLEQLGRDVDEQLEAAVRLTRQLDHHHVRVVNDTTVPSVPAGHLSTGSRRRTTSCSSITRLLVVMPLTFP